MTPQYDVALSFAGEDRAYVEQVAESLRILGVRVFYDGYEEATLWGKDLYIHLREVYQSRSRFTVMFISKHYAAKLWTSHERQSAQARAFAESREYILPARFDDSEVPGLPPTIGYVDIRKKTPSELCKLIVEKLRSISPDYKDAARHRVIEEGQKFPDEAEFRATLYEENNYPSLRLGINPAHYSTIGELLDEMYSHYLSSYLEPFTYGKYWLIAGGSFDTLLLVPWQWVISPLTPIHELAPEWYATPLTQLGILPGTAWRIEAINKQPQGMTWRSYSRDAYFFGTGDMSVWELVLSNAKAISLLKSKGYIKRVDLNASVVTNCAYCGVFEDWLSIGGKCGWLHTGKPLTEKLRAIFRY
jgi:TIR domain